MSIKISLFKSTADGEQLNMEFALEREEYARIKSGEPLRKMFDPYFRLADDRLWEMNIRIMLANTMVRKLSPEARFAVNNVMDVLHATKMDSTFADALKQAAIEVTNNLVAGGSDRAKVDQAIRQSFGDDYVVPSPIADATE